MKGKAIMLFKKSIDYPNGLEKDFFQARKALDIKERINKLDYIKVKNFCCQNSMQKKGGKQIQSGRSYSLFCYNLCF